MAYQLVIFDWDGTVMDSTGRIIACMHQAGADLCLPVLEDDAVREIIGLGLPEALRTLYPGIGDRDLERMRERYAVHFVAAEASPSRLYPGARETLATLRAAGLRLVSVPVPARANRAARKEFGVARSRAQRLDQLVEFERLLRVVTNAPFKHGCLCTQIYDRIAAGREDAVLGLAAKVLAVAHLVFDPGND